MQNLEQNTADLELAARQPGLFLADPAQNDFAVYALRLWRARGFIVKAVLAGALLSAIVALVLPKKYQSTARLMPPASRTSQASALLAGAVPASPADAGMGVLGIQSPSAIYEQVLESRTVEDHLIDKFNLRRVYGTATKADARTRLAAATEVAVDRKSGVVTLTVTAKSPKLAADLAAGYVEELNTLMVELDTSAAHRERVFLESRLKGIEQDLENYSNQLSQFTSKNAVVVGDEQSKAVFTAAETLRGQAIAAKANLLALQQEYTADNERVREAQARLNELESQLSEMRGSSASSSSPDGFPSIRELPLLGAKYSGIYRQLVVEESAYESLTKQYEMAKVEEARDLPTVRVIDEANVPEKKSSPKRTLLVLAGTFLAFLFSCAFVFVQDWWRASRSPWRRVAGEVAADLSRIPGFRKTRRTNRQTMSQ